MFDLSILEQADADLEAFKQAAAAYTESNPYIYVADHNKHSGEVVVRVKVKKPLPASRLIPLIGNCVHNLRDPLDHLVTALAERHSGTVKHPERTEFPIFKSRDEYAMPKQRGGAVSKGEWGLQEIAPDARNEIELLQPYHRTGSEDSHPLWRLSVLSNVSKHRHPLAAGAVATKSSISINEMVGFDLEGDFGLILGAFEDGAVLARFKATQTSPNAVLHFNPHVATEVAFSKGGPAHGAPVISTLEEIRNHVRNVVIPALERFL